MDPSYFVNFVDFVNALAESATVAFNTEVKIAAFNAASSAGFNYAQNNKTLKNKDCIPAILSNIQL